MEKATLSLRWYCTPKVREKNLILGVFCMSIYDFEFKLKVVKDYLKGNLGYRLLAKKYGMPSKSPIVNWVRFYKEFGDEGLHRKHSKKVYPVQFKLDVLNFKKQDRKSTRLNSSHVAISYAVFCLKKK